MALNQKDRIAVVLAVVVIGVLSLARLGFTRLARGDAARARLHAPGLNRAQETPVRRRADAAAPAARTEPPQGSAAGAAADTPTTRAITVCGLGTVAVDAHRPIDVSPFAQKIVGDAGSRWLQRLADSDELRARAAGLLLTNWLADHQNAQHDTLVARDDLVQLAVGSGDPALYALAYAKCQGSSDASCRQVAPSAWARLDPDNAAPWLLAAADAHQSGDRSAEAAAIARAAQTHRLDSYNFSLLGFAVGEIPRNLSDPQRYFLLTNLLGSEVSALDLHSVETVRYCREEVPHNPAARPQCAALAELFAGKGSMLIELSAAAGIGSFSGWSAERVAHIRQQVKALLESVAEVSGAGDQAGSWSCDTMARANRYFGRMASQGEVGAAREAQLGLGIDAAELAGRYDARIAEMVEKARNVEQAPIAPQP